MLINTAMAMVTSIIRVAQGAETTLSHLYINGLFACYLLEDSIREIKVPEKSCIPEGEFKLSLNTTCGMHQRYLKEYPSMHKGMVEIQDLPNFKWVFFHRGNTHLDTAGCPLIGHYWIKSNQNYELMLSAFAYRQVYPKLADQILSGNNRILIENKISNHAK